MADSEAADDQRPGAPPPVDRRTQIMHATVALLLEDGLTATRTRAVTARSGVGTGLLNHYFRWNDLRATAWKLIFDDVAKDIFAPDLPPDQVMDRYFAGAFVPEAERFWRLWLEAIELARQDEAIARVLGEAQARMDSALCGVLGAGNAAGLWRLADPEATAVRLGALYDGLAGLLHSGSAHLTRSAAEAHLRCLFDLECAASTQADVAKQPSASRRKARSDS